MSYSHKQRRKRLRYDTGPRVWWLSFANEVDALGVCYAEGRDLEDVLANAKAHGIEPHGRPPVGDEVMAMPVPSGTPLEWPLYRFVSATELRNGGYSKRGEVSEDDAALESHDRAMGVVFGGSTK